LLVNFVGGDHGPWRIEQCITVTGRGLVDVSHLDVTEGRTVDPPITGWVLRASTSNERDERTALTRRLHHGRDLGEEFDFLTWLTA
jgi:hypothetical protein